MEFILASGSPRRKELLEKDGFVFRVESAEVDEVGASGDMEPRELVLLNAKRKAYAVSAKNAGKNILAADTIVVCEGEILGKPENLDHARRMLKNMSGKIHEVLTAVVWIAPQNKQSREHVACSRVKFRDLSDEIISDYLEKVHVLDKAGAYALQEYGEMIVEQVEGSRTNVIGLPMEIVKEIIQ